MPGSRGARILRNAGPSASCYTAGMSTFYLASEPTDYTYGHARELWAPSAAEAVRSEACRVFDEEGVDHHRPVDVLVAEDATGKTARRYSVRRRVEVRHEIASTEPVAVPTAGEMDD